MKGPIALDALDLAIAAFMVLFHGAISVFLGLGIGKRILIASIRTVGQLLLLGLILQPLFDMQRSSLVLLMCGLMLLMASREAVARTSHSFKGIFFVGFASMALGTVLTMAVATFAILEPTPWWSPRYLIPLTGMILGNSLTGVSLGIDRTMQSAIDRKDELELYLATGATPWQASRLLAQESLRTGLTPILNAMSAVGIVSIPGMMTGQILGGSPPGVAARYQILIMFLIAGAVAIGCTTAVLLTIRGLFDDDQCLRLDRLKK